jgi:hypothetical protein
MNNLVVHHSHSWIVFTYVSFVAALAMVVGGIVLIPLELPVKGWLSRDGHRHANPVLHYADQDDPRQ